MKARLYRATGEARNYIDAYTLYFPYPKWYRKENGNYATGCFLGCSPASDGTMIRCCWDEWELSKYGAPINASGRKIAIDSMPEPFRNEVRRMESLWEDACRTRDFSRWNNES